MWPARQPAGQLSMRNVCACCPLTYNTGNEQGELPQHVASLPAIKEALGAWDVARTDVIVEKWRAAQEERKWVLSSPPLVFLGPGRGGRMRIV